MKTRDTLNLEIEALRDEMQREVNQIKESLKEYSDYSMTCGDLLFIIQRKIKELTSLVSQHKEAK